jgi:hypothetical protein
MSTMTDRDTAAAAVRSVRELTEDVRPVRGDPAGENCRSNEEFLPARALWHVVTICGTI